MDISVYIDGVDKTNVIRFGSLKIDSQLNDSVDSCRFSVSKTPSQTYSPAINKEVIVYDGATKIFGGVITEVSLSLDGHSIRNYDVQCKDYAQYLDRKLVTERYESQTVQFMIEDIMSKYAVDFTYAGVDASAISLDIITFDRETISDALTTLAKRFNYFWYVDYEKDLHFFAKETEAAPFALSDTSENYVYDSLEFSQDFTQIRNRIRVKGGESEANPRTLYLNGTGTNKAFPLAYKFAKLPTITVGGTPQTVGVDGLDDSSSFDVLWSYSGKSLTFTTAPASAANNIVVTGIPLLPISVIVSDAISIASYGVYEFKLENDKLATRDDAIAAGRAELAAYKDPVVEATFSTNEAGLRSGQVMTISSAAWGITEEFVLQKVSFTMISDNVGQWNVSVSTLKTLSLTALLASLLKPDTTSVDALESLFALLDLADPLYLTDSISTLAPTSAPYYYDDGTGTSSANPAHWNYATWT